MNFLFRRRAEIIDPRYNAQSCVARLGNAAGNSAEYAKTKPIVVRAPKKKLSLPAAAVIDERAHATRTGIAITEIERAGNENRFVVDILSGRGRVDHDFRGGRHGVRSDIFPRDQSSAIFRKGAGKTCGILEGRR